MFKEEIFLKLFQKKLNKRGYFQTLLQGQHYCDMKTRQSTKKKKKNITYQNP